MHGIELLGQNDKTILKQDFAGLARYRARPQFRKV